MLNKRKFYINGQWVDPIKPDDCNVINPSTEENCAVISIGSKEDVNLAVKSAKDAFESWSQTSKEYRIKLIEDLYSNYKKRWNDFAKTITTGEGGMLLFNDKKLYKQAAAWHDHGHENNKNLPRGKNPTPDQIAIIEDILFFCKCS